MTLLITYPFMLQNYERTLKVSDECLVSLSFVPWAWCRTDKTLHDVPLWGNKINFGAVTASPPPHTEPLLIIFL